MNNGNLLNSHPLVQTLSQKIQLFKHLGIEFLKVSRDEVVLKSLLSENTNHKGTAFGGSLYSIAVTAAYALALQGLRERGFPTENIVIKKGEIQYLKPVESDFEVSARFAPAESAEIFFEDLQNKKSAQGTIRSEVRVAGDLKAVLTGVFIIKS